MLINRIGNIISNLGAGLITRYLTILDGSADYYTIPTVALTGDFQVEIDFITTSANVGTFFGDTITNNDFLITINSGANIRFDLDGTGEINAAASYLDGETHRLKIKRVGTSIEAFMDGVSFGTGDSAATWNINRIGTRSGSQFFNGTLSNASIKSAGNQIRYYKMDETWDGASTVLVDYGTDGSNGVAVSINNTDSAEYKLVGKTWVAV